MDPEIVVKDIVASLDNHEHRQFVRDMWRDLAELRAEKDTLEKTKKRLLQDMDEERRESALRTTHISSSRSNAPVAEPVQTQAAAANTVPVNNESLRKSKSAVANPVKHEVPTSVPVVRQSTFHLICD